MLPKLTMRKCQLSLLVLILCMVLKQVASSDPDQFFSVPSSNFQGVRDACIAAGAELASLHDADEMLLARGVCSGNCYIGLVRDVVGQPWYWLDGTATSFFSWDNNQPNQGGGGTETKVVMTGSLGGKWHDWLKGESIFPGICRKKAVDNTKKVDVLPWTWGQKYTYFQVPTGNFLTVRDRCHDMGGELASIHSYEEQQLVWMACPTHCYIGMVRDSKPEPWYWLDGTPADYFAWANGQPNSGGGGDETKVVHTSQYGHWHDWLKGEANFPGVCQVEAVSAIYDEIDRGQGCSKVGDCPAGWTPAGTRCFKKVTDNGIETMTADRALKVCREEHPYANLPTVTNEDEALAVWHMAGGVGSMNATASQGNNENIEVWIGQYKIIHGSNTVVWLDGSSSTWGVGPSNTVPPQGFNYFDSTSRCVRMRKEPDEWWDIPCSHQKIAVCQICQEVQTYTECPADWIPASNRCFRPLTTRANRNRAALDCRALHPLATLPSVTNAHERDQLWRAAGGTIEESNNNVSVWLSLRKESDFDQATNEGLEWTDGTNSTYGSSSMHNYYNFDQGTSESCVVMEGAATTWSDTNCDSAEHTVVCQIKKGQAGADPSRLVHLEPGFLGFWYLFESNYDFSRMPDVRDRQPDYRIVTEQINYANIADFRQVVPDLPHDHFVIVWLAEIWIQTAGDYTFYTRSDDGSIIYIDGHAVVDNDGLHSARSREGTVYLLEGLHPIRIDFYERTGLSSVVIKYTGPDTDDVEVFLKAYTNATQPPPGYEVIPGEGFMNGYAGYMYYYEDRLPQEQIVNIAQMPRDLLSGEFGPPNAIFLTQRVNFHSLADFQDVDPNLQGEYFAIVFLGNLTINECGTYTLTSRSDDGSLLFIDGQLVVDNDGAHAPLSRSSDKYLESGVHPVRIEMFERRGQQAMAFYYSGPDTHFREVPAPASVDVAYLQGHVMTTPPPVAATTTTTAAEHPSTTPPPITNTSAPNPPNPPGPPGPEETPVQVCPKGFSSVSWEKAEDLFMDPAPRLLAYWPLSEDTEDKSGNDYHLIVPQSDANIHGVTFDSDPSMPAGLAGTFANFGTDGKGGLQVSKGGGFHGFSSSFTLEYWVKINEPSDPKWSVISYCKGYPWGNHLLTGGGNESPWDSCRVLLYGTRYTFSGTACTSSGVSDGNWHHVAYVRHLGSLSLYIDGEFESLADSKSITTKLQDGGSLVLGQDQDTCGDGENGGGFDYSQSLKGGLAEVRIWQGALSKVEIQEYMHKSFHTNNTCPHICHEHAGCVGGSCSCLPGFKDRDSASLGTSLQGLDCVEIIHCAEDFITGDCEAGLYGIPPDDADNAVPRLIGYWPLSDDLLDKSGRDNHLEVPTTESMHAPTFKTDVLPPNMTGGYADFGTDGKGALQVNKVGGFRGLTGSFTIEYWIKINTPSDPKWSVVSYCKGYSWGNHLLITGGNDDPWKKCRVLLFGKNYNFPNAPCDSSGVSDGNWHHVAYVRDGDTLSLIIDGEYQNSVTVTAKLLDGGSLVLGQDQDKCEDGGYGGGFDYSQALEGGLTEVRIWQGARELEDIRAHMHQRFWMDGGRCEGTHPCHRFAGCHDQGDIICTCLPGYKDRDPLSIGNTTQGIDCVEQHVCTTCLPSHFCPANTSVAMECPPLSTSRAGSDSIEDCECIRTTFFEAETFNSCLYCPAGFYCPGGENAQKHPCPPGSNYCPPKSGTPSFCLPDSECYEDTSDPNHIVSSLDLSNCKKK